MKIRLKSDSLRFRLTRSEVARFAHEGVVVEKVHIGDETLTYVLQRFAGPQLTATLKNNIITLNVPEQMADEWINTDRVGFDCKGDPLYLLVEKDFTCLENVDEDQSDNYPNPLAEKRS
ncbi:hypothetical protein GCM10027037_09530 [Mucilaginibacter koreensis]